MAKRRGAACAVEADHRRCLLVNFGSPLKTRRIVRDP